MGRSSDRTGERKLHTAIPLLVAGASFACVAIPVQPFLLMLFWLTCTGAALWAWTPSFWIMPTLSLGASAAAASFGLINLVGNLGGFFGPSLVGYLLSDHRPYPFVIVLLSIAFAIAAALVLLTPLPKSPA